MFQDTVSGISLQTLPFANQALNNYLLYPHRHPEK